MNKAAPPHPDDRLTMRRATFSDVPMLMAWYARPHVAAIMGSGVERDWEAELNFPAEEYACFIAEADGRPIGCLEVVDPALERTRYWGELPEGFRSLDIWIGEPDMLGKGWGTQMMLWAIGQCFADPAVHTILLDPLESNEQARRFYKRIGFWERERRRFGQDDSIVCELTRAAWENQQAD